MKQILTTLLVFYAFNMTAQNDIYSCSQGCLQCCPENTLASAKLALMGAHAVDDIHLSKDNRLMVIHDKDTKRTCSGKESGNCRRPSTLLRDLDAGIWKDQKYKGETIPFLAEMIETVPAGKNVGS